MVNKDIARQFNLLASLMELHGENAFKIKAYANAYLALRKWDTPIVSMSDAEIDAIPGIGASVAAKIKELLSTGSIEVLEKWKAITPEGIQSLLMIKGLGPKKVRIIWDALHTESPVELLYACNENRLVALPGFGFKTQEDLRQKIRYFLDSQHKYLFANIEEDLGVFLDAVKRAFPSHQAAWAGQMATMCPVIDHLDLLIAPAILPVQWAGIDNIQVLEMEETSFYVIEWDGRIRIRVHGCAPGEFSSHHARLTMSAGLWSVLADRKDQMNDRGIDETLRDAGFANLPGELWDMEGIQQAKPEQWSDLVEVGDIKGILHNHSTWSDGLHTLEEMAFHVRDAGYAYFAICDHSRSAFYANGLSPERVLDQMDEIDRLNQKLTPFKIFKGIESDILGDGQLDYDPELLARFDLIVASIHSNLRMDEDKAMSRLIKAIENPFTSILGHPTGRLLLSRQGYPIDHKKVIDACAANGVAIELNANPLRLDVDYHWMGYCMEKNVMVSINPDAHSRSQVGYVRYGVLAARKGGLKKQFCLNTASLEEFESWLRIKNRKV